MKKPADSPFQTILLLDTTARDQTRVAIIRPKETVTLERPVRAQELQVLIEEIVRECEITLSDVNAVAVMTGPGSFTGTRIGITAANALGWLYKLPLVPIVGTDFETALSELEHARFLDPVKVVPPSV